MYTISNVITIDKTARMKNLREGKNYVFTNSGSILYPIGMTIPIIQNGVGCIGTGSVVSFTVTENLTEVRFTYTPLDVNSKLAVALYNMYRGSMSAGSAGGYDGEDVMIPGAMGTAALQNAGFDRDGDDEPRARRGSSIFDFMDDEDRRRGW